VAKQSFDLEASRRYWRNAPSGAGKHDTSSLIAMSDDQLLTIWLDGFRKRFAVYPEEDQFLAAMSREFAGKRMLSIGSGLGFHEMVYASHGARITCCDIAPSNLAIIKRVAGLRGVTPIDTFVLDGSDRALSGSGRDLPASSSATTSTGFPALPGSGRAPQTSLVSTARTTPTRWGRTT
jgi:hypothetical protein